MEKSTWIKSRVKMFFSENEIMFYICASFGHMFLPCGKNSPLNSTSAMSRCYDSLVNNGFMGVNPGLLVDHLSNATRNHSQPECPERHRDRRKSFDCGFR